MDYKIIHYLVFFILCFESCVNKNTTGSQITSESKELPVTKLIICDTFYYSEYVSEIKAKQYIEVRARVKGFLEQMYVDEGKFVRKGTVIFHLSDAEYSAALAKSNANLKNVTAEKKALELDQERVQRLVDSNVISNTELKIIKARVESLNARIEEEESNIMHARVMLSYTDIRAPYDGHINRIIHKVGSLVDEGTLLTTLSDNSEVLVYFNVSEKEYLDYIMHKNISARVQQISLILADGSLFNHKGTVETIEGEIDATTGSIAFRARFPNPDRIIKHGASGKVRLTRLLDKVVLVPLKSTFDVQDRHYIYTVDSTNRLHVKEFISNQRIGHFYVLESGLEPDETILYEGTQIARDTMTIIPKFISMEEILNQTK